MSLTGHPTSMLGSLQLRRAHISRGLNLIAGKFPVGNRTSDKKSQRQKDHHCVGALPMKNVLLLLDAFSL